MLLDCFDGLITLTQVDRRQDADIVVHYVPTAGGVVFGGYATCGDHGWPDLGDPVLSRCDVEALAFVFAWALEGVEPYPPAEGPYVC